MRGNGIHPKQISSTGLPAPIPFYVSQFNSVPTSSPSLCFSTFVEKGSSGVFRKELSPSLSPQGALNHFLAPL